MPFVNVKIIEGQCDLEVKQKILTTLTDLIVNEMNRDRNFTNIVIDEIKPSSWAIGGKLIDSKNDFVSFVNIKVSKGTTNPDEMSKVIKLAKEKMSQIMGNHIECNYIIIDELNPDAWGFGNISMSERGRRESENK